jgi:hypothetical protein
MIFKNTKSGIAIFVAYFESNINDRPNQKNWISEWRVFRLPLDPIFYLY